MCKVEVVARTFEKTDDNIAGFEPEFISEEMTIFSGRAAGICYAPEDYLDNAIHDSLKAKNRAVFNAKSGHYSVYEHGHVSFIIQCSKAIAMVLNSTRLYATSEKSARYTFMKAETDLENQMYQKWKEIFIKLISAYYDNILAEKDIEKLAMENARYMISVFTNTTMEFTVPFGRAILLTGWLDQFANNIEAVFNDNVAATHAEDVIMNTVYYARLAKECRELAESMRESLAIDKYNPILKDHKGMGIDFLSRINEVRVAGNIGVPEVNVANSYKKDYYGNVYVSNYVASFASVAQIQRHRTLQVEVNLGKKLECYIPDIIKSTPYEAEWIKDFTNLVANGVCPQGTLLNVTESGRFEDFVLKCKERLCTRAQYETMRITQQQVQEFNMVPAINLSAVNRAVLATMIAPDGSTLNRCRFSGYCCKEPCKFVKTGYIRNV